MPKPLQGMGKTRKRMYLLYLKNLFHVFPLFLKGLGMTVAVSGISLVTATLLGLICGILKTSRFKILRFFYIHIRGCGSGNPFFGPGVRDFLYFAGMGDKSGTVCRGPGGHDHHGRRFYLRNHRSGESIPWTRGSGRRPFPPGFPLFSSSDM